MRISSWTLFIGLVFPLVCYGSIKRKCEDGDPNCLDSDYHYEEAAKEIVLDNSNRISFNMLTKHAQNGKRNLTPVDENLKEWWREWYQMTMELPQIKPEEHVKPLCKPDQSQDNYIECENSPDTQACIGTKSATIGQCKMLGDTQFLIPVCKERSSNRVVTCGILPTFLCYPLEEKKPPIKPCHNPFRQICLSQNGSLVKCIQTNFLTKFEIGSLMESKAKDTLSWWRKWQLPIRDQNVEDLENKSAPLCFSKEGNGELRYCDKNRRHTAACFNVAAGKVAECKRFTDKEMIFPICSEITSKRVITCDKSKKAVLCFSSGDAEKPVQPCDTEDRQICLNENGLLQKCIQISKTITNSKNDEKAWNDWWFEWVSNIPVTEEGKDEYLCKPNEKIEKLTDCSEFSSDEKACVSAKRGEIDLCRRLNDSDLPVPLCKKGPLNKLISCNDYGSAFLCFDRNVERKSIRPCRLENRHLCLTDEGLLKGCSDLKQSDDSEVREDTIFYKDDFLYWHQWWEEWFSIRYGLDNNLSESIAERLCLTKNERMLGCVDDFSSENACVGAKTGKIAICEGMQSKDFPIPICREIFTNRVVTCGRHTNAFLCFPKSKKSSFMKPCLSFEREACLGPDGKLELCVESNSNFTFFRDNESKKHRNKKHRNRILWNDWWQEWKINPLDNESSNASRIPLCKQDKKKDTVSNCKKDEDKTRLCVSSKHWNISDCEDFKDSDQSLLICSENSSKRILTCGNNTSAFLCIQGKGKSALIFPCRIPSRQLCLSNEGMIEKCSDDLKHMESISNGLRIPAEYIYAKGRILEKRKNDELRYLCKNVYSPRISACSSHSSHPPACLNTKKGNIESCENIERNSDIGLPVCIHVTTSKLYTCGKFSEVDLCFPRRGKLYPIKPCKKKSRNVCITGEGKLAKCSKSFENVRDYYSEENEANVLIRMEYKYFKYEFKNITPLCIYEDKKMLKECTTDPAINFACLSSKKGLIHSCESGEPFNLSIPLCIKGPSKAVVTCGKFNNVNLCSFEDVKGSTYRPCKIDEQFVCFRNGLIDRCRENNFIHRKNDRYLDELQDTLRKDEEYQITGYQNSKKIYDFESQSIQAMLRNCSRLCVLDDVRNEIRSCEEDLFINFACLGAIEGTVKSCKSFSSTELIMPVCVERTKKVLTHGKFFKAYLCFQEIGDDVKIQTCTTQKEHICLTKKGTLEKCNHNENGKNTDLLERSQKEETSSPEQSTIKSHFNAKINDNLTSKKNGTIDGNRGEITDDYITDKLIALTTIKSNNKTFRVSEGKHQYKRKSDKSEKRKKVRDKNSKRENEKSNNQGNRKSKHVKKYYDNSKNTEGTKKSNEEKSKSRAGKYIKEFRNMVATKPSVDEVMYPDKYEYGDYEYKYGDETYPDYYSKTEAEEMLRSGYLEYVDMPQEEYETKHRKSIKEKELKMIADIHVINRHLCKLDNADDKLINCDRDSQLNFACVGVKGNIKMCRAFEEIAFPVCFQANSSKLVTCDIFSNVQLCIPQEGESTILAPCQRTNRQACLGEDGVPKECGKHVTRRDSSMLQFKNPDPNDEKFYRLLCTNCKIETKFILEGEPEDVLPTLEVFTFPPK